MHACVFPVCEFKGAAAKRRVCFFPSGVTPTPLRPAAQKPVELRNQRLQVWLASECDILQQANMSVKQM